jgi:hypothetical protein
MEAKLFGALYRHVYSIAHTPRRAREQFCDRWIVMVYLLSVLCDRPVCWICDERNWPTSLLDGRVLPSQSRMSRRLRTIGVVQLIERVTTAASELFPAPLVKKIDSKPLVVGAYSKDVDARRGRLADGQFARGYRLHAVTHGRAVQQWTLMPLNAHDSLAAPLLLPKLRGGGYVVADNAYDTNACHGLAAAANHQLVAPPRACNKDVRDAKYNCPQRLRALDMLHSPLEKCGRTPAFGRDLYNCRQQIESGFGGLTFAGLGPLPPWVRGARRVALWTAGKILAYLCRCAIQKGLMG